MELQGFLLLYVVTAQRVSVFCFPDAEIHYLQKCIDLLFSRQMAQADPPGGKRIPLIMAYCIYRF